MDRLYLDSRIKNTPEELTSFDRRMNRLVDRILDEFGLIICGWSAEWDIALSSRLEKCKNQRFTTYWAAKEEISEPAKKLVKLRRAQIITIKNADSFFREITEKVLALEDFSKPHPLSAKVAIATLKKYIADERYKIDLHDLVMRETEKLYSELNDVQFSVQGPFSKEELITRTQRYEALTEILLSLIITGCYWGEKKHETIWARCLSRIANPAGERSGYPVWLNLRLYPALILFYGGGMASIAAERYGTFASLLINARIRNGNEEDTVARRLNTWKVMEQDVGRQLPGMDGRYTPLSDHLYNILRNPLKEFLPDDVRYEKCFDRFEYLLALVCSHLEKKLGGDGWGPVGRFGWKYGYNDKNSIEKEIQMESEGMDKDWPPLKVGLFDGFVGRFQSVKAAFDERINKLGWRW